MPDSPQVGAPLSTPLEPSKMEALSNCSVTFGPTELQTRAAARKCSRSLFSAHCHRCKCHAGCFFWGGLEGGCRAARVFWEVPPTPLHCQRCYCSREGNQRQRLPNASGGVLQVTHSFSEKEKSKACCVFSWTFGV